MREKMGQKQIENKTIKLFVLVLLTFLLTSCSTKLIYNYADWLISWEISDFVDLNETQKQSFDSKVDEFLRWHRTEELPYYSSLLKQLRIIVVNRDDRALDTLFTQVQTVWLRSVAKITPEIIELLSSLSKTQKLKLIDNIKSIQKKKNQQWQDKAQSSLEQRFEDTVDKIKEYIGSITPEQREYLLNIERQRPDILALRIDARKYWLELFSIAIVGEAKIDSILLHKLFTDLSTHRSTEQQKLVEQMEQLNLSKARYLLKSMSTSQQTVLLNKIDKITSDVDSLAKGV